MIVDSSAIIAIVANEPSRPALVEALAGADKIQIAAPTWLEASIVLESRFGPTFATFMADFETRLQATVLPFTREHALAAQGAWQRFGKGRSPAALNFGDCIVYAAAQIAGEPVLFVGNDFTQTDVESVL